MQQNFNDLTMLFPTEFDIDSVRTKSALLPFSVEGIDFLNALAKELMTDQQVRAYPDVATFAFYCRKSNILKIKENYSSDSVLRLGRGVVFHIAPSNVPVNFAYSLVCGILSGNVNIVRVPSKEFEQVSIICNAIIKVAATRNFAIITDRIFLVRFDRQSDYTASFSSLCDVRVIWGGDETISQIRKNNLPSRSFDVTFADRYSLCVINADRYILEPKPENTALGFYNDTYLFDQNACTAPHLVVWTGSDANVRKSKEVFWNYLYQIVKQKQYVVQPVIAIDKLTALYNQAVEVDGIQKETSIDNLIWRIQLNNLSIDLDDFRCSSGYFSEYQASSLGEIATIVNRKYQTLAYYGFNKDELKQFVLSVAPVGIDRIVPIGKTTDFSVIWDGYDLIRTLSRCCDII